MKTYCNQYDKYLNFNAKWLIYCCLSQYFDQNLKISKNSWLFKRSRNFDLPQILPQNFPEAELVEKYSSIFWIALNSHCNYLIQFRNIIWKNEIFEKFCKFSPHDPDLALCITFATEFSRGWASSKTFFNTLTPSWTNLGQNERLDWELWPKMNQNLTTTINN